VKGRLTYGIGVQRLGLLVGKEARKFLRKSSLEFNAVAAHDFQWRELRIFRQVHIAIHDQLVSVHDFVYTGNPLQVERELPGQWNPYS